MGQNVTATRSQKNIEKGADIVHKVQGNEAKMWLQNGKHKLIGSLTPLVPAPCQNQKCVEHIPLVCNACLIGYLKKNRLYLLEQFKVHRKWSHRGTEISHHSPRPTHVQLPVTNIMNIPHRSGSSV